MSEWKWTICVCVYENQLVVYECVKMNHLCICVWKWITCVNMCKWITYKNKLWVYENELCVYECMKINYEYMKINYEYMKMNYECISIWKLKLVLQQSKNVTAKCTETLSPPRSIQFSMILIISLLYEYHIIDNWALLKSY